MKNFKFTGVNLAAAVIIIAFFLPWFAAAGNNLSMSGFSITTTGISPGMLSMMLTGLNRLCMILAVLLPLCAGIILYQNVTGSLKYNKFYKPAHYLPTIFLVVAIMMIYFKLKPDVPDFGDDAVAYSRSFRNLSRSMQPGLFDIMGVGLYMSLGASLYLLLTATGKIKDKEYYRPATDPAVTGEENGNKQN